MLIVRYTFTCIKWHTLKNPMGPFFAISIAQAETPCKTKFKWWNTVKAEIFDEVLISLFSLAI